MTDARSTVEIIPMLALRYGLLLAAALLLFAGGIGWLVAGIPGLLSGTIGGVLTALLMGLTALSVVVGSRLVRGDTTKPLFYGVVLASLAVKLIVFVSVMVLLRGADWLQPTVLAVSMLVAVSGSLAVDLLAFLRARVPYVDVELPGPKP